MFGKKTNNLLWLMVLIASLILTMGSARAAVKDSDADGLIDQAEINTYHTDPDNPDTDGDSFSDSDEILAGSNPLQATSLPAAKAPAAPLETEQPLLWALIQLSGLIGLIILALIAVISVIRKKRATGNTPAPIAPPTP